MMTMPTVWPLASAGGYNRDMALLKELKRRRVFRVAGLYGVTAWIVTEVSATVIPALYLPEELVTIIVVLLIAGFPIALVLAWIFDINPDGIQRTQNTPEVTAAVHSTRGRLASIGLIVLATSLLASLFFWRFGGSEQAPLDSIAVLPFVNLSNDANSDYFSDGVSEELLNLLTKVPGLKVAARTSSFAFKNQETDIRDIAAQLGVATVLEGSVRWSANREQVRITAQLIDASSGYHLWSGTYDRKLEDIFAVQDEIARAIVTNLQIQLTGVEAFSLTAPPTRDAEAYTLYLRGRALWKQRGLDAIEQSVELFQAALARDPGFSRAYSNLAAAYVLIPNYSNEVGDTFFELASEAALTALTIDESLAEAHAVLARISDDRWSWSDAQTGFFFATSLDPSEPTAHHWYSIHLGSVGRYQAALKEARLAAELDKKSAVIQANLSVTLDAVGFNEAADAALARAEVLGFETSTDEMMDARHSSEFLNSIIEGDLDTAFRLAGELAEQRSLPLNLLWSTKLVSFRQDPRFPELMSTIGLTNYWRRYGWADGCGNAEGNSICG